VTPTRAESLPPSNVPEIATAMKMSTASTSIHRQRWRGAGAADSIATGGSSGAAGVGSTTTAGAGGGRRLRPLDDVQKTASAPARQARVDEHELGAERPYVPEPRSKPAPI
jgi:hypothetical protein